MDQTPNAQLSPFQSRLLACKVPRGGVKEFHWPSEFIPISRFEAREIAETIDEMETVIRDLDSDAMSEVQDDSDSSRIVELAAPVMQSTSQIEGDGKAADLPSQQLQNLSIDQASSSLTLLSEVATTLISAPTIPAPKDAPHYQPRHFTDEELTEDVFRPLWAHGDPIVVTGLLEKFKIPWTPEYFRREYERTECHIVECQSDVRTKPRGIFVSEFFEMFGKYDNRDGVWKLKVSLYSES